MSQFLLENNWVMFLMVLWMLPWKGVALWKAARLEKKWWFIVLLVVNTLGILDILYIFVFSKPKKIAVSPEASQS